METSSSVKLLEWINSMLQKSSKEHKLPKEKISSKIYSKDCIQRPRVSKVSPSNLFKLI